MFSAEFGWVVITLEMLCYWSRLQTLDLMKKTKRQFGKPFISAMLKLTFVYFVNIYRIFQSTQTQIPTAA